MPRKLKYQGDEAPGITDSPLYDLTLNSTYPEDIYSDSAARLYGEQSASDHRIIAIIKRFRNKPERKIRIYRAIPKELIELSTEQKLMIVQKHKAYILKYGKTPKEAKTKLNSSEYFEILHSEEKKLMKKLETEKKKPKVKKKKVTINSGDWVTIDREYAKIHGQDNLRNNYKILSKTVKAKEVFTEGNSLYEWGYVDLEKTAKKKKRTQSK